MNKKIISLYLLTGFLTSFVEASYEDRNAFRENFLSDRDNRLQNAQAYSNLIQFPNGAKEKFFKKLDSTLTAEEAVQKAIARWFEFNEYKGEIPTEQQTIIDSFNTELSSLGLEPKQAAELMFDMLNESVPDEYTFDESVQDEGLAGKSGPVRMQLDEHEYMPQEAMSLEGMPQEVIAPEDMFLEPMFPGDMIPDDMISDGQSEEEQSLGGGEKIFQYEDGRTVIEHSGGLTETEYPDGKIVMEYEDGAVKTIYPDGKIVIKDKDGAVETTSLSGDKITKYPDGFVQTNFVNGLIEIKYPNGTVQIVFPDGINHYYLPDGSKQIEYPNGDKEATYANGITQKDYKYSDGRVEAFFTYPEDYPFDPEDLLESIVYSDGITRSLTRGGKRIMKDQHENVTSIKDE